MNFHRVRLIARIRGATPIGVAVAALAAATSAQAAVFSVASPGTPGASDVACAPCATIQGGVAKAAAAAGADEVQVAAGTFNENVTIAAGNEVTLTGAGVGATTLNGVAAVALTMDGTATVRRIRIIGTGGRIVDLNGGTLAEAAVESPLSTSANTAVNMGTGGGSAILRDSTVRMPLSAGANYGVYIDTTIGSPQILRSSIEAGYAVDANSPRPVSITHSTLHGNIYGVLADAAATSVTIESSLVLLGTAAGFSGTGVSKRVSSSAAVTVTGSTIVGTGRTKGVSAESNASVAGSVTVVDSILWGHLTDIDRFAVAGGNPTISLTRTLYDPNKVTLTGPGVLDTAAGGNLLGASPGFVSELTSDFRLLATSPAVDAGTPGALAPADPVTDILGDPRLADGNGDGALRRDLGAFERPPPPAPTPPPPPPPPPPPSSTTPKAPATPRLSIARLSPSVLGRPLRLRITAGAPGRLVLIARNAAGRVVGRRVVLRVRTGKSTVTFRLSSAARAGALVVSATLTGLGALPAKDVQFTRLVAPPRKKTRA